MPKYVVSGTLTDPEWNNTTVLDPGDLAGEDGDQRALRLTESRAAGETLIVIYVPVTEVAKEG
jgi:hypothetical protein